MKLTLIYVNSNKTQKTLSHKLERDKSCEVIEWRHGRQMKTRPFKLKTNITKVASK